MYDKVRKFLPVSKWVDRRSSDEWSIDSQKLPRYGSRKQESRHVTPSVGSFLKVPQSRISAKQSSLGTYKESN